MYYPSYIFLYILQNIYSYYMIGLLYICTYKNIYGLLLSLKSVEKRKNQNAKTTLKKERIPSSGKVKHKAYLNLVGFLQG